MKDLGNFLVGSLSSLGMAQAIPDTVQTATEVSPTVINSVEAIISLITGLLSTLLMAWARKKMLPKSSKKGDLK